MNSLDALEINYPIFKIEKHKKKNIWYLKELHFNRNVWHPWSYLYVTKNGYANQNIEYASTFHSAEEALEFSKSLIRG